MDTSDPGLVWVGLPDERVVELGVKRFDDGFRNGKFNSSHADAPAPRRDARAQPWGRLSLQSHARYPVVPEAVKWDSPTIFVQRGAATRR